MKEHPIIFSTDMVRAILEGRKTQTRRVIEPQLEGTRWQPRKNVVLWGEQYIREGAVEYCPYGQVGDRLWVRESWRPYDFYKDIGRVHYKADNPDNLPLSTKWRSPFFMRRWASRINLEITGLRVERLQEISVDDIKAEGIKFPELVARYASIRDYRGEFQELWDSINAKRDYSWGVNPWVWVIEFKITKER